MRRPGGTVSAVGADLQPVSRPHPTPAAKHHAANDHGTGTTNEPTELIPVVARADLVDGIFTTTPERPVYCNREGALSLRGAASAYALT